MAQRRKRDANYNDGTWGVSEKALKALDTGTYGQLTGRKSKYRTSQEQTQQTQDFPMLEGMFTEAKPKTWERKFGKSGIDTDRARRNYAAGHTPIGRGLTQKDADIIANAALDMLNGNYSSQEAAQRVRGNVPLSQSSFAAQTASGIAGNYAKNKDWEKEYGKSLETLIEEYANSDEAMSRHFSEVGRKGNGLSKTLGAMVMNAYIKPIMGARTIPSNIISPDSEKTNKLNKASELMSDVAQSAKDSTTRNAGTIGKGLYDFGTNVGERLSRDITPFGWILNGLATAEDVRQELSKEGVTNRKSAGYGLARGTLDAIASRFAGKLGQNSKGANFATRALKSGAKQGTLGGIEQTIAELADAAILGDEGTYNRDVQNYMARGLSEEEARDRAWENTLLRIGGMAATRGTIGAVTSLGGDVVKGVQNKLKDLAYRAYINRYVVDPDDPIFNEPIVDIDDLNEYFAPQNALEGQAFPQLTGTVDNTQALTGSQYNVPALVDNIYPIQMPGTNGVINLPGETAPIQLPDLAAKSAPKTMKESTGLTNRVIAKLTGEPLTKAQTRLTEITNRLGELNKQIPEQYNNYKIAPKTKRRAEYKKYEDLNKEKADLIYEQYAVGRQIEGQPEVSRDSKDLISKYIGDLKSVGNMYAGKEGKKLANDAITALQKYERTGNNRDYFNFVEKVYALENAAVNPYTNKSNGKVTTYGTYYNDEDGSRLTQKILPSESPSLTFEALMQMLVPNAQSAPIESPAEVPLQAPISRTPQGQIDDIMTRNVGKKRPYIEPTPESNKAREALDAERIGLLLSEEEQTALKNIKTVPEVTNATSSKGTWDNPDVKYVKKSFRGKIKYISDSKNEYANTFLKALGEFEKNPTDTTYQNVIKAHQDYSSNAGSKRMQTWDGRWYEKKYDPSDINKQLESVAKRYGINTNAGTNEPNFTTVGQPYTPQEVPNVKPTPPTPEPPTQEVPNMGGTEKTSKYYNSTMRNTETNQGMSDEEYAQRYNEELYKYMTRSEQQSVGMAHDFINESGGNDAAIKRLLSDEFDNEEKFNGVYVDACHILANDLEQRAMQMEESGQDASELWRLANRLHKKVQENGTVFAQGLQANKKWKKTTSQGALDDLIIDVNRGIDNKKTTGYTKNVNKLADKVEDAIASSNDKAAQIDRIKRVFAQNRENNQYDTRKAEQQVLNLVGGSKNTKKSVSDLIEEAGKVIKKEMGVSTLTAREERAVLNLLDAASKLEPGTRAYNVLVSRAMTIVDESLPTTIGEKAKSLLYDNMLASIKTMFTRNLGGNVVGNAIDFMAAPFQVGADAVVGKFTGARTRTLTGKSIVEAAKGLGHGFKDWGQDIGYSIKNKTQFNTPRSGQESLKDVLNAVHKTWKTQSDNKVKKAVTNALATYDYIIRKGMEGGDRPIYEAQYAATKAELYDVIDKYGDKGLRMGLPADKRDIDTDDLVEAIAINDALEAVLQNDSTMKEAAKNLKSFFKKSSEDMLGIDIASMSHAPFVEVPANMASNFFKLTPIGWAGNIARTIGEKKKYGSINQRRFTGELGLNVLGGLMIGGGTAAAGKYISDAYSDKKEEKKLQQNNGYQEYALQTPDESTQIDISDIPYLGGMMKFSKLERDAYDKDGLKGAIAEIPSAASAATVDTLYSALNRLTGADFQYSGDSNLINNAINNVKSSVGSMGVPSLVRQTAQYLDPYKRDLGDYGTDEYNKNLIINGIPGLRQTMLEPKIDTAGQPVPELGGATGLNRFLSAYVSPWKVSHPHANTSAVQEYANMLKQTTNGEVNPQMKVINKSDLTGIKGYDAENYSHADLRKLQEAYYKSNTELGNALINDPWFTNLSAEKQGELLDQLWSANKALVKENFVREGLTPEQIEAKGDELYTTDNKLAGIIRDDDENHTGLIKWLHDETDRDAMNEKYGTEMSHDNYVKYNDREEGYAEQRASETDKAKALDMSVDSYEKYEAEYPGGAQGYYDDREGAKQYGFVNANKVPNVDSYRIAKELGDGDPNVIQAYSDYKQEGIKSNAYAAKAQYLAEDDRLTDEQKGMIIAGSTDGTKIGSLSKGAQKAYDLGGYAGINYYYLLKDAADADGSGTVTKKERQNFFASDFPMLDELWQTSPDLYNYAMENLK